MTERDQIRRYVRKLLDGMNDQQRLADDESLVLSGRLSSVDVVGLFVFLETNFNFSMDPSEFDLAKFDSVDAIAGMLGTKGPE